MSSALDKLAKRNVANPVSFERVLEIPLSKIRFDPTQPRKAFHTIDGAIAEKDAAYITELAVSIEHEGLIQNITVQEMPDGTYLVVVGECRTRAHLQLGRLTIKAVVRNDLTNVAQRLLYQLAENVNRQDLTDFELAASIRDLMAGKGDAPPMTQVQIAKTLGKSEGWVSRFVKFGDEELQRLWVNSGIADTVEKLYRLSILPKAMQVDIMRRVELPENDSAFLVKPLLRDVIDMYTRDAKIDKAGLKINLKKAEPPSSTEATLPSGTLTTIGSGPREYAVNDGSTLVDPGQALASAVIAQHTYSKGEEKSAQPLVTGGTYQLSEEARAAILGKIPNDYTDSEGKLATRDAVEPPVNCRGSIGSVTALLKALNPTADELKAIDGVRCDLSIPGRLAQLICNELTGIIVDRKEVPAILQIELAKLR